MTSSQHQQQKPANMFGTVTPPTEVDFSAVSSAARLLRAQADALCAIATLFESDKNTQSMFFRALSLLYEVVQNRRGKIVFTGIGKSLKIVNKLVATLHSFGIPAASLHPTDALHGDLGCIRPDDAVILVTASGNTPELLDLLPHLPTSCSTILLTCKPDSNLGKHSHAILPAVIPGHLWEKEVYGLPAPTTTATACLAVGDAMCITLNEMIHMEHKQRKNNFDLWHPGGAIGAAARASLAMKPPTPTISPRDEPFF